MTTADDRRGEEDGADQHCTSWQNKGAADRRTDLLHQRRDDDGHGERNCGSEGGAARAVRRQIRVVPRRSEARPGVMT
eukprot:3690680-Pyramimonas_sp.AAC.1